MARPQHRGLSGGGSCRFSGNGQDLWDDSQMKEKIEKEDLEQSGSASDQSYLSVISPLRILFPDSSPSKGGGIGENGFLSDPFNPGTGRSRFKFTLLVLRFSLVAIVVLSLAGSFFWTMSITKSSKVRIYHGYRRLQEQVVLDLKDIGQISLGSVKPKDLDYCPPESENYVPCFNVTQSLGLGFSDGEEYDRHCTPRFQESCLVPPPVNYRIPLRWPTGRDVIWLANVNITAQEVLSSGSLTKRMMMLEEEKISFRSESSMFDSIEDYSHQIAEMIGLRNESNFVQAGVRLILDIGCGFGSFGAHLFSSQLLTMCIANYEASGSQVQLTLERGLPAMIGSFNSMQLPYPSLSFDMIHCAECHIDWDQKDGILLIEVDRLLRPGGYFVWTSSVMNARRSLRNKENEKKWNTVRTFAENLHWELLSQQDETVVWKKTSEKKSYSTRKTSSGPSLCSKGNDIESPYYRPLQKCIGGTQSQRWIPIEERTKWPSRARLSPIELKAHGKRHSSIERLQSEDLAEDYLNWNSAVNNYWSLLSPLIFSDHPKRPGDEDPSPPYNMLRNVLDMNAHFGGFNAALLEAGKSVWVMNVIPTSAPNYLPLILDRGFVGVLHDWCEPFPTYPRTYDLVHADGLLSLEFSHHSRCGMQDLFTEIDRVLRPEGWFILRDTVPLVELARTHAARLKWDARVAEIESTSDEKLLVCQKPFIRRQAS
nr:probable pectin methyltransferase QUA2 isoform X1 [Ipomoea trifida]